MPKMPQLRMPAGVGLAVRGLALVAGGGYALSQSLFNVDGGFRGVVFNKITGVKDTVYGEGTHFLIPFVERATIYSVRSRPRTVGGQTGTKDLQMVNINLRVLTRPDESELPRLYQSLGEDYDERVLPSIVNEVLKGVVAQFNAAQLITQRNRVSEFIRGRLKRRAEEFHILLDDVAITHLAFGPDYTAAVEAKQVAQQEAERAKFIVEKAEQDKRSAIVRAKGEAEAARLISEAMSQNPNFLMLRQLEAARYIASHVARGANKVYLDSDNLLLNLLGADAHDNRKK